MKTARLVALDILFRMFLIGILLTHWFFALLALPWAWLDSIGSLGWTTMKDWRAGWRLYSCESLREGFAELVKPLGVPRL